MTNELKIGDIIEGEVTGIQNYGVFVSLSEKEQEQGLVHISECKHGFMGEITDFVEIGQKVKVVIVDIDEYTQKISLSMRALCKLETPTYPRRNKKHKKRPAPNIGFKSLENQMPKWIASALDSIEKNEFGTKIKV